MRLLDSVLLMWGISNANKGDGMQASEKVMLSRVQNPAKIPKDADNLRNDSQMAKITDLS